MATLREKLLGQYPEKKPQSSSSWIPQRMGNDPLRQLKRILPVSTELSQTRATEIFDDQSFRNEALTLIRDGAKDSLIEICGGSQIENKMAHFDESWLKVNADFNEEYGTILFEAMLELAGEGELVGYDGYIDKKGLKKRLKELKKGKRQEKNQ